MSTYTDSHLRWHLDQLIGTLDDKEHTPSERIRIARLRLVSLQETLPQTLPERPKPKLELIAGRINT
jgi:hypothetical protein